MTLAEGLLVLILIILIGFTIYYYFRGSSGKVEITRPIESRLDEYLDRRFDAIIEEWALVRQPQAQKFRDEKLANLATDEKRMAALKEFEKQFGEQMENLEERLGALEKQIARK